MSERPRSDNALVPVSRGADERLRRVPAAPSPAASMDIKRLLAPMLRHRWILIGTTIVFAAAAAAYVRWALPQYRATATIRRIPALTSR